MLLSLFDPTIRDGRVTSRQKYIEGMILGRTCKIYSDILPIPPLILTRVKRHECWHRFWTQLLLKRQQHTGV